MKNAMAFIQLVRPKQWTKNLVVFAGVIFSAKFMDVRVLLTVFQAFVIFCLAAGAIYIFNDIRDLKNDRLHPVKKHRPIAAGKIKAESAAWYATVLVAVSLAWAAGLSLTFMWMVLIYLALNVIYSLGLKNQVILDVFLITIGFVLRAVAGAWVIPVPISPWLLIVTTLLSLFLGFAKRRHELVTMGQGAAAHRKSLQEYSPELLDQFMGVVASSTIIAYSLYAFTSDTARQHNYLMLTVPFVIYGILRYLYLVYQKKLGGSPELVLLQDQPLLVDILLWIVTVLFILHLG